ncbi:hypothetical protein GGH96_002909 [Coemansia sp. RSA 1972]|nr:hypothetical protein GGH96_002909 [Coemansia sp. RSA 1972]
MDPPAITTKALGALIWTLSTMLLLLGNKAAVVQASPVPQDTTGVALPTTSASSVSNSESSVSPTASAVSNDSSPDTGMNTRQIYYILAIGACSVGVLAFVITYVYRKRRQRQQAAQMIARDGESGHHNAHRAQPRQRQRKERIVLSQGQFDMLPHIIAQGTLSADSKDAEGNDKLPPAFCALSEAESCSICLSDIVRGEELVSLIPCNHQFHIDCVSQWLMQKSTKCPLCKADMLDGLGFQRPKSIGDDNDDIELVTIPANNDNTLTNGLPAEPHSETDINTLSDPTPPPQAAIVDRRRSLARP